MLIRILIVCCVVWFLIGGVLDLSISKETYKDYRYYKKCVYWILVGPAHFAVTTVAKCFEKAENFFNTP